jgi:hypothetical protein
MGGVRVSEMEMAFCAVQADARYACRSMRSEREAESVVTRNQEGRPAVALPAGSVRRSNAQPHALAPGISGTAKQRIQGRLVARPRPPEAVH